MPTPILATGTSIRSPSSRSAARHPGARAQGFTLLEIMVVVVIIGIVAASALLSLGRSKDDTQLTEERERLGALFDYVRERAALSTVEYGLQVAQNAYAFSYYDNRTHQWLRESLDEQLRPRPLPPGLAFNLDVEGHQIVLKTVDPAQYEQQRLNDYTPQIMLFANGDSNDFALTLLRVGQERQFTVKSSGAGGIDFGPVISTAP